MITTESMATGGYASTFGKILVTTSIIVFLVFHYIYQWKLTPATNLGAVAGFVLAAITTRFLVRQRLQLPVTDTLDTIKRIRIKLIEMGYEPDKDTEDYKTFVYNIFVIPGTTVFLHPSFMTIYLIAYRNTLHVVGPKNQLKIVQDHVASAAS